MSGICDTCRRTTCEYRADDIAVCGLPKSETNYERLFGTPERAAHTVVATNMACTNGECSECPFCGFQKCPEAGDYDALVEWLREEGESDEA